MRGVLVIALFGALSVSAACVGPAKVSGIGDVRLAAAAPDRIDDSSGFVEMPPLYVDGRESHRLKVERAATEVLGLSARELRCPTVHVRRADHYTRADGSPWTVVRVHACGEDRVYERVTGAWQDATARLR